LIGVLVVENGQVAPYSFWADNAAGETKLFRQLLALLDTLPDARLFHYGSYEARVFQRILNCNPSNTAGRLIRERSVNVLSLLHASVYFPTYSRSLKEIGSYLGFVWATPGATGLQSLAWRSQWEETRDIGLREQLLRYNLDDCGALKFVTEYLLSIASGGTDTTGSRPVQDVEELAELGPYGIHQGWSKGIFANDDFRRLQECSYFDYQREKVFLKTNPTLKRLRRRKKQNQVSVHHRPNRVIELTGKKCPRCGSVDINRDDSRHHVKQSLDLRFMPSGIRRRVIEYHSPFHSCGGCNVPFLPASYKEKRRYGHGLIAWSMDQHVGNRVSFQNLAKTVEGCFGLGMSYSGFYEIKCEAAQHYKSTYNRILRQIVGGGLAHADETKVLLQQTSAYVWVLTNMEDFVFIYRPTRETGFLRDLLGGFAGTLVTDYYPAYDALPFRQQKCLIHFVRDLNGDILGNPLDVELQALGSSFGKVMRDIVGTTERFGLRAKYLQRHMAPVRQFIGELQGKQPSSAVMAKYRNRILKYGQAMFAFLERDGVPWNNNNAEHAIRHLAEYRKHMNGRMNERGLTDYLVLLSIHETCRCKGIRFLDFLRSRSRDVDDYAAAEPRGTRIRNTRSPTTDWRPW
jgi:hypothetical protein